tara:strand:+ start:382 stop:852 length:471 start_codon:yes stop_codon:yes gene_type:complete
MDTIKRFAEFVNESSRVSFRDAGISNLMDLKNATDSLTKSNINWDQKGQALVFRNANDTKKAKQLLGLDESLNEGTLEVRQDAIAQEYDAEEIGQLDMDDFPNAKEIEKLVKSKKFKYLINATHVSDNSQSFNDLKATLQKARVKFTELAGEEILF